MKFILLIFCFLPIVLAAQEVRSILSADYLRLIRNDSLLQKNKIVIGGATNDIDKSALHYQGGSFYQTTLVKKIIFGPNNTIVLKPAITKIIYIAGTASTSVDIQHPNRLPALQKQYVQGEPNNGQLIWQGPETGELFSFGPSINNLEFDGRNYSFDVNGKLVVKGAGNGINAKNYNNPIFRTAVSSTNSATLQAKYQRDYQHAIIANFTAAQRTGNTFIINNKNVTDKISALLEGRIGRFTIAATYNYQQQKLSNSNRSGFLNGVYQNAMLTPTSFDNNQGTMLGNAQKSYSPEANNPLFLLDNHHSFLGKQNNTSLILDETTKNWKIKLVQSYEKKLEQSNEGYKPGTAFFPNGFLLNRTANDANYFLNANAQYVIPFHNYRFSGTATANYIFENNHSSIHYLNITNYEYKRSSHDAAITFAPRWSGHYFESGISVANKMYASNTSLQSNFFLTSASGFVQFNHVFRKINVKFSTAYNRFNSELRIDQSFAQTSLLPYSVGNALQFLPITEVTTFNNLSPIEHKEHTVGLEVNDRDKFIFSFDWFSRRTHNDVFPILDAGQITLQNLADHRNQGIELQFTHSITKRKWTLSNAISFVSYQTKVTDVKTGYDLTPIAGFSNVHKAIVKGQPLGVIIGNTYLKDADKNVLIATDGFPLVNNAAALIGNPNPDFTIKTSHHISYKKWDANLDWEWKKGGDIWNGTEAMLDYHGKSANSGELRNTINYVFNGVQANGSHNVVPVSFNDPSLPILKNRWVRYGPGGVAENYIEKGDCIRLNNIGITYKMGLKNSRQQLVFMLYVHNIIVWSAYKGADPNQLLNDQTNGSGLDFFNLPSYRSFGFNTSLKF